MQILDSDACSVARRLAEASGNPLRPMALTYHHPGLVAVCLRPKDRELDLEKLWGSFGQPPLLCSTKWCICR